MTTPCTQVERIAGQGEKLDEILVTLGTINRALLGSLSSPDSPGLVGRVIAHEARIVSLESKSSKRGERLAGVAMSVLASIITAAILASAGSFHPGAQHAQVGGHP